MSTVIRIEELSKNFGNILAVDNISFEVEEKSLFAFLGPNGAGKSTTVNIICTLMGKTKGRVFVDGFEAGRQDEDIRKRIGVVFQESLLDDLLTVRENIETRASFYGIEGRKFVDRLDEISSAIGINDILNRRYGKLSGGQRRRADIARALINTPRILFLDEPTTGLDPQTRRHVWDTVRQMQQKSRMTVFLTTHYMEEAALADRVAVIDYGKLVASGTPSDLRMKYSSDSLKIKPKNYPELLSYLKKQDIKYTGGPEIVSVQVSDSMRALEILKQIESMTDSFEVLRGNMDDVFLNITGRQIRDEEGE